MTQVAETETGRSGAEPVTRGPKGPPGRPVQLNTFQLLMRRWRELHPYNAGQAMRVSGRADFDKWRQAVTETIREMGLGIPTVTDKGRTAAFSPVDEVPVSLEETELGTFTNIEMNRPFRDDELPIRFTVLPGGGSEESHLLVAIYDHWIADSRAMRELMHRIWERYRTGGETTLRPLTIHAPHFCKLFRKHIGFLYRSRAIRESLKSVYRHRHAWRLHLKDPQQFESHMIYIPLPEGLITRVHAFGKARNASVNDVFLAVIGQLMGDYTASERYKQKRKRFHFHRDQVGLGTIVDIRDAARQSLDHVFGLYLSSYTVVLPKPEQSSIDTLTRNISERTRKLKRSNAPVKGVTALMMARFSWDLLPKLGRKHLQAQVFQKNVPVTAGISNVNMTKSWVDTPDEASRENGPVVLDYLRISPTGPLLPLVFTLTTIRDRLSLCCTYRTTAFTDAQAQDIVRKFIDKLRGVAT